MNAQSFRNILTLMFLLILVTPGASAQNATLVPGTITVTGEGTASAPAETADIVITIGAAYVEYVEPLTIEPEGMEVTGAIDVSSVTDAMTTHGIPAEDIEIMAAPFMGEWDGMITPPPATILVSVADPTVEDISGLLDIVRNAAHAEGLYVNNFGVVYGVSDCRALRQQARESAVENARREGEDQAAAINTTLGDVVATRDTYPMNPMYAPMNTCTALPQMQPHMTQYMAGQFDPAMPAEVTVQIAVDVSFEIPQGART